MAETDIDKRFDIHEIAKNKTGFNAAYTAVIRPAASLRAAMI